MTDTHPADLAEERSIDRGPDNAIEEVRFSVVLFGGLSLAIYISGSCIELFNLVRATRRSFKHRTDDSDGQSVSLERIYQAVASLTAADIAELASDGGTNLRHSLSEVGGTDADEDRADLDAPKCLSGSALVNALLNRESLLKNRMGRLITVDILSGSSAGGLNAIFLAKALTTGNDLRFLSDLWVEKGDLRKLLIGDQSVRHSLLDPGQLYKIILDQLKDISAISQDRRKREGRSSDSCYAMVDDLDVYLTATDLDGTVLRVGLSDGHWVNESRHRAVAHLQYRPNLGVARYLATQRDALDQEDLDIAGTLDDFGDQADPFLAFVGRATSAHPAAFYPARLSDYAGEFEDFEDSAAKWTRRISPQPPGGIAGRFYSDGGDIDNKPFGYALLPVRHRLATVPVDRKVLYIEPSPKSAVSTFSGSDRRFDLSNGENDRPRLGKYAFDAFNLGRKETIRDDIKQIDRRNRRVAGARSLVMAHTQRILREKQRTVAWVEDKPKIREEVLQEEGKHYNSIPDEAREDRNASLESWLSSVTQNYDAGYETSRYERVIEDLGERVIGWAGFSPEERPAQVIKQHLAHGIRDLHRSKGSVDEQRRAIRDFVAKNDLGYRYRRLSLIDQLLSDIQREILWRLRPGTEGARDHGIAWFEWADRPPDDDLDYKRLFDGVQQCRDRLNRRFESLQFVDRAVDHQRWSLIARYFAPIGSADDQDQQAMVRQDWLNKAKAAADRYEAVTDLSGRWERLAGDVSGSTLSAEAELNFLEPLGHDDGDYFTPLTALTKSIIQAESVRARVAVADLPEPVRTIIKTCWQEYHNLDPMLMHLWSDTQGEIDPAEVIRISPPDAKSIIDLSGSSGRRKIGGDALWHFGGFVDERWRRLDLMWGRLDTADILISRLLTTPETVDRNGVGAVFLADLRSELIRLAHLAILDDQPDTRTLLPELSKPPGNGTRPDVSDAEHALTYLSDQFDVEHSLNVDKRGRTKAKLLREVPAVVGRVLAFDRELGKAKSRLGSQHKRRKRGARVDNRRLTVTVDRTFPPRWSSAIVRGFSVVRRFTSSFVSDSGLAGKYLRVLAGLTLLVSIAVGLSEDMPWQPIVFGLIGILTLVVAVIGLLCLLLGRGVVHLGEPKEVDTRPQRPEITHRENVAYPVGDQNV